VRIIIIKFRKRRFVASVLTQATVKMHVIVVAVSVKFLHWPVGALIGKEEFLRNRTGPSDEHGPAGALERVSPGTVLSFFKRPHH
jgi:hypothetical protein